MPPDRLDELEDAWQPERPTKEKLRRIERSGPPESYPPGSSSPGKRWNPAGVLLVLGGLGGFCTVFGATILGPWLSKPDLSGYVKEERLLACEAKVQARDEAHEKAIDGERSRTAGCFDKLGACQSQLGGSEVVIESMRPKKRR